MLVPGLGAPGEPGIRAAVLFPAARADLEEKPRPVVAPRKPPALEREPKGEETVVGTISPPGRR